MSRALVQMIRQLGEFTVIEGVLLEEARHFRYSPLSLAVNTFLLFAKSDWLNAVSPLAGEIVNHVGVHQYFGCRW